ncbi:solute symporter family transporter [Desarmillaria tabescens]|uniref:Solute symporter family transporter n=1 Tax=Armillaria tabescens TaxID=1929756 RepID=A0AA39KF90_ARMTA|nr:solute symporter family transporter [Desarmillaria tabescens]KAK0458801.1 solute symporter family transporter [Desarmillaria tabescens]
MNSASVMDASAPVLSPGVGYATVLGMGMGFAGLMLLITKLTDRYTEHHAGGSLEEFISASRSLKPGLIASGIVSAATWAATLLQSSTWYAAGSSTQIMAFAQNAIQLKRNVPGAHTFLEVIAVRWGDARTFQFYVFFGLGTNIILMAQFITGGSNTVNTLTSMNTIAACFLIPVGVVVYTLVSGLRATFFSDHLHTTLIFAIILAFGFSAFATNEYLGPLRKYGMVFGIVVMVFGFGITVYLDQTYWQRAVASKGSTFVEGYILGSFSFLPVPYVFATAAGLAIVALSADSTSPYAPLSAAQYSLAAPAAATALLGRSGAILPLIVLFLAVTSAASAELVAVSAIITYDIYKRCIHPAATDKQILWVSHVGVVGFGIFMGILGVIFYEIGISLSWLCEYSRHYTLQLLIIFTFQTDSRAFLPFLARHANRWGCLAGLWIGFSCGIAAWLATAAGYEDVIDVTTTGGTYEQLAENAGSFFMAAIISSIVSHVWPENFDFDITRRMNTFQPEDTDAEGHVDAVETDSAHETRIDTNVSEVDMEKGVHVHNDASDDDMYKDFIFSKASFTWWIVLAFLWTFVASFIVIIYPIWESRHALWEIMRGMMTDMSGKRKGIR